MNKETLNKLKELFAAMPAAPHGYSFGSRYVARKTDSSYEYVAECPAGTEDTLEWETSASLIMALLNAAPELIALAERTTSPVSQMTDEQIDRAYAEAYGYNPDDVLVGAFDRKFARAVLAAAGKVPAYPSQSCDEACYYQCTEAGAITPKCMQPVANAIIRDIAELEYDGSEGAMLVTEADLRLIVDRHVLAAAAPQAQVTEREEEPSKPWNDRHADMERELFGDGEAGAGED